ncbi:MAG: hypothetical protein OXN84_11700 [Albidovulum sp.]|nr:hypothetical protein [Albidovulum sp.]
MEDGVLITQQTQMSVSRMTAERPELATVSDVALCLPRYQRAESAAPVASPANCSRRLFEV